MEDKRNGVIVTGASAGIGLAISKHLTELGYYIYGFDINKPVHCDFPGKLFQFDLLDNNALQNALKEVISDDNLWGVVHNAAINIPELCNDIQYESFVKTMDLNVWVAIELSKALAQYLLPQELPGRIVNIASTSIKGVYKRNTYAASKGAIQSLSRSLSVELMPKGITVNVVAPGAFATEMFNQYNPVGSPARASLESFVPCGRIGDPHEIAVAVAYFMSKGTAYTSGQTLYVDGGISTGINVFPHED